MIQSCLASGEKQLLTKLHREALFCGNMSMCTLYNTYSHTHVVNVHTNTHGVYIHIEPNTAVRRGLDCFVLISAAHWCKEEFIKKKKKVKGSIR